MPGRGRTRSSAFSREYSRTLAAWERFAAGEDDPLDVRLSIALSWRRCRDVYRIDPRNAPLPRSDAEPVYGQTHGRVFAGLGGIASAIADRGQGCVTAVADGDGRILASWGRGAAGRRARDESFSAAYTWSETAAGTNGMGTAIVRRQVSSVRGPEHWNAALHDWSCAGIAICDPGSGSPVATLNVACWRQPVPLRAVDLLVETRPIGVMMREAALRTSVRIVEAFADLDRRTTGALVALDVSGRVVAANGPARRRIGGPADTGRAHAGPYPDVRGLARVVPDALARARDDPFWRGSVSLRSATGDAEETFQLLPVTVGADAVGVLACTDTRVGTGEPLAGAAARPLVPSARRPHRVAAFAGGGHVVLLQAAEIRYARSDGHTVWLATDHGLLRAATRGIDRIERDLAGAGFLRVHRSYLVNAARVHDVVPDGDRLTISTTPGRNERIPVSRRSVAAVRDALGL